MKDFEVEEVEDIKNFFSKIEFEENPTPIRLVGSL